MKYYFIVALLFGACYGQLSQRYQVALPNLPPSGIPPYALPLPESASPFVQPQLQRPLFLASPQRRTIITTQSASISPSLYQEPLSYPPFVGGVPSRLLNTRLYSFETEPTDLQQESPKKSAEAAASQTAMEARAM